MKYLNLILIVGIILLLAVTSFCYSQLGNPETKSKFPPQTEETKLKQDMIWKSGVEMELINLKELCEK